VAPAVQAATLYLLTQGAVTVNFQIAACGGNWGAGVQGR
jgi:hypothetical protein